MRAADHDLSTPADDPSPAYSPPSSVPITWAVACVDDRCCFAACAGLRLATILPLEVPSATRPTARTIRAVALDTRRPPIRRGSAFTPSRTRSDR